MEESLSVDSERISSLSEAEIKKVPVLSLAYVGDGVFDIYIRMIAAVKLQKTPGNAHRFTVGLVNAASQSRMVNYLLEHELLTEDETEIFKRGRNAKPGNIPKNALVADYHRATGFEAVLGYLYMLGRRDRAFELCELAYKSTLTE